MSIRAQVGKNSRRGIRQAIKNLDQPALLGDKDATIWRETDIGRVCQAAEDNGFLKTRWDSSRLNDAFINALSN